jgi:hypothetical protein
MVKLAEVADVVEAEAVTIKAAEVISKELNTLPIKADTMDHLRL